MIRTIKDFEDIIAQFKVKALVYINKSTICIIYYKPTVFEFQKKKNIKAMKQYIEDNKVLDVFIFYATFDKE